MTYNPEIHNDLRPNVGVTVAAFIFQNDTLKVLTYKRDSDSEVFPNLLALPNSPYLRTNENSDAAAVDAVKAKTGLSFPVEKYNYFTGNYIDPDRINTVNLAYIALGNIDSMTNQASLKDNSKWVSVDILLEKSDSEFAFNHKEILVSAVNQVKDWAKYNTHSLRLLPDMFTISEFRDITEYLLGAKLNNSRFRDRVSKTDEIIIPVEGEFKTGSNRPAQLYRYNPDYKGDFYPRSLTKPS